MTALATPTSQLVSAIRASLTGKLERLLRRPIIASVIGAPPASPAREASSPDLFQALDALVRPAAFPRVSGVWREDPADGTCRVRIALDYDDRWRGYEREVIEAVAGTVEGFVTFLTEEQKRLLERSPREFLGLNPPPEVAELVTFGKETVGGAERVTELTLAEAPKSPAHIRYVAIVPNLIPLERQLAALGAIERAPSDGPLGPLRVLLGLDEPTTLASPGRPGPLTGSGSGLDEHQAACVQKALGTPHFAAIKGPPGSGKTTVISTIIRQALDRGERVLVVSPTHVAVDNVVEKLAPRLEAGADDDLEPRTLPVRFAARPKRLLRGASAYWVGPKRQIRAATVTRRVEGALCRTLPLAQALYDHLDEDAPSAAPLSAAVAGVYGAICGTPIGILSFDPVRQAEPGAFDLLVVDEVSKMTLPEFLAIAVKARRWVLVGDPEQLPPFNNGEENATTLDDLVSPALELVCTIGAILERVRPGQRADVRLVVVASDPEATVRATQAHLRAVGLDGAPPITTLDDGATGIVVCTASELAEACALVSPVRGRDRTFLPEQPGSLDVLVERGIAVTRPAFASGARLVEARLRAQAVIYDNSFAVYHAQPWAARAGQKLAVVRFRKGLDKYLPSAAALSALGHRDGEAARRELLAGIAARYAINAVSVYDWLTGAPVAAFDTSPLQELGDVLRPLAGLREAVRPFVGTLRRQYRMHPSLSKVPRELFYFGEALEDGAACAPGDCRVRLMPVEDPSPGRETNEAEAQEICRVLGKLRDHTASRKGRASILVITPYRAQERLLGEMLDKAEARGDLGTLDVEVCTLDRCQGREADYVFISLVRSRATPFLDAPKRWNVALTRAKEGLFLVGDTEAYLREAASARRAARGMSNAELPLMSLLARIVEQYDQQILTAASSRRS